MLSHFTGIKRLINHIVILKVSILLSDVVVTEISKFVSAGLRHQIEFEITCINYSKR